jgi:hypothetical protein
MSLEIDMKCSLQGQLHYSSIESASSDACGVVSAFQTSTAAEAEAHVSRARGS